MIMKMEKEMKYEAPAVEVLKVEVELGFAGSVTTIPDEGTSYPGGGDWLGKNEKSSINKLNLI